MEWKTAILRTESLDLQATRWHAEHEGFATFVLPAQGIVDRATFFEAVRVTLPLDPPVLGVGSWDALSDSLWQGLHTCEHGRIAIFWPGARAFQDTAPSDFEMALNVLADVSNLLADRQATLGSPKVVAVVVELDLKPVVVAPSAKRPSTARNR